MTDASLIGTSFLISKFEPAAVVSNKEQRFQFINAKGSIITLAPHETSHPSFAETALRLGGKSDDEARRTGAIDQADDDVESLFAKRYQTTASPAHRAVWDDSGVPVDLFWFPSRPTPPGVAKVMDDSVAVVHRFQETGKVYDDAGKITNELLEELGSVGYWGPC